MQLSLKCKNLKSFGNEEQGFSRIASINIIIGRNNTGKSALLDLVQYVVDKNSIALVPHMNNKLEILLSKNLTSEEVASVFSNKRGGGPIVGNHWDYGKNWVDKKITVNIHTPKTPEVVDIENSVVGEMVPEFKSALANINLNNFRFYNFRRLLADRDIEPQEDNPSRHLEHNGSGATNIIQNCLYDRKLDLRDFIENDFLDALNSILQPDIKLNRITCEKIDDRVWEIFLDEDKKGRIPLSHSGSGLKTVVLAVLNILVLPKINNWDKEKLVFLFEELENNMHPALQRRLADYLKMVSDQFGSYFFITTHSNIMVDSLSRYRDSQIIHVKHDGNTAHALPILNTQQQYDLLNDLDFRASDVLQTNGVIWVEGPSDRIYVKKWISLVSSDRLLEGEHYTILHYGGKLLSHLSMTGEDFSENINLLLINRNCIIILDSDKKHLQSSVNATKKRILESFKEYNCFAWISKGREIENYINEKWLQKYCGRQVINPQFGKSQDLIREVAEIKGKPESIFTKVFFASEISEYFDVPTMQNTYDLYKNIQRICGLISKWNAIDY